MQIVFLNDISLSKFMVYAPLQKNKKYFLMMSCKYGRNTFNLPPPICVQWQFTSDHRFPCCRQTIKMKIFINKMEASMWVVSNNMRFSFPLLEYISQHLNSLASYKWNAKGHLTLKNKPYYHELHDIHFVKGFVII